MGKTELYVLAGAALLGVLALTYFTKVQGAAENAGLALGSAAAAAAGGVVAGAAETIGDAVGVPRTDAQACAAAQAAGQFWEVSKYCPASTFLGYSYDGAATAVSDTYQSVSDFSLGTAIYDWLH